MAQFQLDRPDQHPLIGEMVWVKEGAKPAGWPEDEEFDDLRGGYAPVTGIASAEEGFPFGTIEVGGWWYAPESLQIYSPADGGL